MITSWMLSLTSRMLAGYIVNTVHERSFIDNRLFKKQYWHSCVSTSLSATTTCKLGFLRWEQQEKSYINLFCSQPPVAAPPPIMFLLFLNVLFHLLYHTLSECCLPYKQYLVCSQWLGPWLQLIMYPPSSSKHWIWCCLQNDAGCNSTTISIPKRQQPWWNT